MTYDFDPGVIPGPFRIPANKSTYAYWPIWNQPMVVEASSAEALGGLIGASLEVALPALLVGPNTVVPEHSKEFHTFVEQVHTIQHMVVKECKYLQPGEAYAVSKHGIQKVSL